MPYDHISLEQKWQKFWEENKTFRTENPKNTNNELLSFSEGESFPERSSQSEDDKKIDSNVSTVSVPVSLRKKKYILDMFPYPSGAGLHVGHPKGYTATDIVSRYYHAKGYNVLHPMGFDAFGLPAENYAIKTGTHPAKTTAENIATFTLQMKNLGFSYDWDRMVDTTDPEYYKWTQWIFLELFKRGLAYEQDLPINYCPSCKTGLANEEVLADNTCDRCGTRVERRPIRQWVLKITEYADRLLSDIDNLDWPEGIKEMQRNWIGKSEGCEFRMLKEEGFIYSKASKEDFERILEIRKETGWHTMDFAQEDFLVAKHNHEIAGFIRVQNILEYTELGALYVLDAFRGSKLGYKLVSYAIEQTHTEDFYIDCRKELQNYYEKIGFSVVESPLSFQMEKLKKVWTSYGKEYTEEDIINLTAFMSIRKNDFISQIPSIRVYTTRIDTVYGVTYAVLAPDHPKVEEFITDEYRTICDRYIEGIQGKSDLDRTNEGKEKTGVFTGSYVVNPFNGESVPLWIADYVLGSYGTGAVMAVPAHDERDFEFAKKYNLEIKPVIAFKDIKFEVNKYTEDEMFSKDNELYFLPIIFNEPRILDGLLQKSGNYTGLTSVEARKILSEKAEKEGFGHKKVNYKLRDWLFSRQRYWGEPIPLIHISHEDYAKLPRAGKLEDAKKGEAYVIATKEAIQENNKEFISVTGSPHTLASEGLREYLVIDGKIFSHIYDGINGKIVIESNLPLTLPEVEKYEPAGDGQSPLATVPEWVNVKLADNLSGKRETNTMPQWGGSCWYYLRYMDSKNQEALAGKNALEYWRNVDEYVGGAEHAVLHLLYARFWHKVLYDIGVVPTIEPFQKLTNVGMILAYAYERSDGGLVAVDLVEERDGKYFEKETGKEVKQVVAKMSKSLKNVVNPNDIVAQYGADTLRLYEMSMSGFTDTAPWNPDAIIGVRRFLDKAYATFVAEDRRQKTEDSRDKDMKKMKLLHKTVKKVGEDVVEYKFNTAISALMILLNEGVPIDEEFALEWKEKFAILLHPFAPHMAEELYSLLEKGGGTSVTSDGGLARGEVSENQSSASQAQQLLSQGARSIYDANWPDYDDFMLIDDEVTIAVQVNGKLRGTLTCLNGVMQDEVSSLAYENPDITKWVVGKTLVKEIYIPNKMLSIVVKD